MFVLIVMELKTRRIEIAGVTAHPDSTWIRQMGRNLTDSQGGFLQNASHLLIDRDTKFFHCANLGRVDIHARRIMDAAKWRKARKLRAVLS